MTLDEAHEIRHRKLHGYRISESLWAQALQVIQEAAKPADLGTRLSREEYAMTKPNRAELAVARKIAAMEAAAAVVHTKGQKGVRLVPIEVANFFRRKA